MTDTTRRDPFDRVLGAIDGLPDVRKTRASTFTDVQPILGDVQTYIVQTWSTDQGLIAAVQMIEAGASYRLILPPKVTSALYRQRDSLIVQGRKARGRDRWDRMSPDDKAKTVARLRRTKA